MIKTYISIKGTRKVMVLSPASSQAIEIRLEASGIERSYFIAQ